jgi:tetratricopeptide (TPR) repeat protein
VRVASIIAFGGVGKSALVNAWLAKMNVAGWGGARRVYAWSFYSQGTDRLSSSDAFIDQALRDFGDADSTKGSPWDKGERLARLVRRERTILVLDGVEPLQEGPRGEPGKLKDPALKALVKELAAQNEGMCLITSRIALTDLEGAGRDAVRSWDLEHLTDEAGAALLHERGARGGVEHLRAAAREMEGHSLALTLLGSWVKKACKGDVRKRDTGPQLPGKPAQRMMGVYEEWFAGGPELSILRLLGLFDRPAPPDEIAAVRAPPAITGLTEVLSKMRESAWNEAVSTLREVGLLLGGAESDDRLDAHPLVREHFGEQLRVGQPEAWKEGHRRLYEHLKGKAKLLPETVEEMEPLDAAVVHGCMAGKGQEALDDVHWKRIKRRGEHFSTLKLGAFGSEAAALSAFFDPPWERLAPGLRDTDQAFVLTEAGMALRAQGRLPEAASLMRLGLERRISQENWTQAASAASSLSELFLTHGELSEAEAQARKSVELADRSGDAFQCMARRTTLAAVQHARGRRAEAAASFEEAERMQEEWRPSYPLLFSLRGFQYCDLLLDHGRDAGVRERAAQTLVWVIAQAWLLDIALDHLSLGRAHLLGVQRGTGGDLALATSHLQHAVEGLRKAGELEFIPLGLLARAALHLHTGDLAAAHRDLTEALDLSTRCEFRLHECDAHLGLTRLALAEGDPARAQTHLEKARTLIQQTGYHRRDGELADLESKLEPRIRT